MQVHRVVRIDRIEVANDSRTVHHMGTIKSLDRQLSIIAAMLSDVQTLHSKVFSPRSQRLTYRKVVKRCEREGISFLTKALPRLGKSLDRALSGTVCLDSTGFAKLRAGSKLPKFLGELFGQVFSDDGWVLPTPCVTCIRSLRQLLFVYYKLDLPYNEAEEEKVIQSFKKTEEDILPFHEECSRIAASLDNDPSAFWAIQPKRLRDVIRKARGLLSSLLTGLNPKDIRPKHGPGAVSTKEKLWDKYMFTRINPRIEQYFPFTQYFTASYGHICDAYRSFEDLEVSDQPAKVILVPKDSRGPRLISEEPLEFQWIQQGLKDLIVEHVERHHLTKWNVRFTDQQPNQFGALLGSLTGQYATLDLKEASDRISVGLVKLLFPHPIVDAMLAARSESTILPDGEVLKLNKFAPMGSALCFPTLALTIWALLTAGLGENAKSRKELDDTRESIYVYGDDVIVPTAEAANAIMILESFGLLVNRDKSFIHGFFRESCGVDAFKGVNVTPCRIKAEWTSHPSPNIYTKYIAYANNLRARNFRNASDLITRWLCETYREIPQTDMGLLCPSLDEVPETHRPKRYRINPFLQKKEWLVYDVTASSRRKTLNGWLMLLRYFSEAGTSTLESGADDMLSRCGQGGSIGCELQYYRPFRVRIYTPRDESELSFCWR